MNKSSGAAKHEKGFDQALESDSCYYSHLPCERGAARSATLGPRGLQALPLDERAAAGRFSLAPSAGSGALNRAPDALSRHRDKLILARAQDWDRQRASIERVQEGIRKSEFDTDEPELVAIDQLPAEAFGPSLQKCWRRQGS